jgi:hypothetical protein
LGIEVSTVLLFGLIVAASAVFESREEIGETSSTGPRVEEDIAMQHVDVQANKCVLRPEVRVQVCKMVSNGMK